MNTEPQLAKFLQEPTHALLLAGTDEAQTAPRLAKQLLDTVNLATHAYYREIAPEKGNIAIEQIRKLTLFFRLKVPGKAKIKRLAVIRDAELMSLEAQNALLKLLEEPPVDSILILVSSQPRNLLSTIRSRVQTIQLPSPAAVPPEAEAVQLVKQVLAGSSYGRLLLVDSLSKQKDAAAPFVSTLARVAMASLEAAARKGSNIERWQTVLQAAHTAEAALQHSGNIKLALTELMLAM